MEREKFWILLEHIDIIDDARESIVSRWIEEEEVARILVHHGIEQAYFADAYADAVLGYFIDVIHGDQQIGDCPVIAKLLDYLQEQEVSAAELFTICTHFRKAMIDELFSRGVMDVKLFDAVSYVYDKNFFGVLEAYTTTIQQARRESRAHAQLLEQYKLAIDASNLVSMTDRRGIITYVNDRFEEVSGYKRDELLGSSHNIVRHPDQEPGVYKELWETIKAKQLFKGIIKNRTKSGSSYFVDATIIPIFDLEGDVVEYLAIRHDVTELIEARDRAVEAEKAKDQFLANMSHELRTPMNAILGFVHLLNKRIGEDRKSRHFLEVIQKSSEHLLAILGDLLDFAKIKNGAMKIEAHHFLLRETLESVADLFAGTAAQKRISYLCRIDPFLPKEISGDPVRLSQIVTNLLSNAFKFTPEEGQIVLKAVCERSTLVVTVTDNGPGIPEAMRERIFHAFEQVESSDTRMHGGTGLGLSISSRLAAAMGGSIALESREGGGSTFTLRMPIGEILTASPAYTVPDGRTVIQEEAAHETGGVEVVHYMQTMYPGYLQTAASLSGVEAARLIVSPTLPEEEVAALLARGCEVIRLGGEENDGEHEEVFVLIPPIHAGKLMQVLGTEKSESGVVCAREFQGRVLVVEDQIANQQLVEIMLDELGLESQMAGNGAEAVELVKHGRFDLILMDQQMPVMNGVAATRAIRAYEKAQGLKPTPIIALSANVFEEDVANYLANGMNGHLEKPIDQVAFMALLETYLAPVASTKEKPTMHIPDYSDLDPEKLADKIGLRVKHIPILVGSYLQEGEGIIAKLKEAITAQDFATIQHEAHSIKGSSGNLKFDALYEMAKAMEMAAKAADVSFDYAGTCEAIEAGMKTIPR